MSPGAVSPSMLSVVVGVSSRVPGSDVAVLSLVFVYGMLPPSMVPELFWLLSVLLGSLSSEAVPPHPLVYGVDHIDS